MHLVIKLDKFGFFLKQISTALILRGQILKFLLWFFFLVYKSNIKFAIKN